MAKYSPNNITSLGQDWGLDTSNGLPFSGAAVQSFIKSYLGAVAKASYFDSQTATMYWFASDEDKAAFINNTTLTNLVLFSTALSFSSDLFRISLTNNNGTTTMNIATNQQQMVLSVGFDVQTKAITDATWSSTNSGVYVTAQVDPGAGGQYDTIHEARLYTAGETYTLDVRQYLIAGANRVRLSFVDEDDDSVTTTITYTINMTEMFIEPLNNRWYVPIIEGGDTANYLLGGYRIVGALNKTLHIVVYSQDAVVREFSYNIGTSSYDQVPFYYTGSLGFDLSGLSTGVYLVSAYLTSGVGTDMITSLPVNNNVMYIAEGEESSTKLVCINNVEDVVYNYTTSTMFKYAIYNQGALTGSPAIVVRQITGTTPTIVVDTILNDVATSTELTYEVALEWLTEETLNLTVRADMTFGNEQTAVVPVDNSATFPPTSGFNFYMNAAARANSDANYLKVVNEVGKNNLTPTWDKMVWAEGIDGWITDDIGRKGLYLRAGSKMVLPYTEYQFISGDGITLEMCYRVSNVADYDETVISIMDDPESAGFRGLRIKPTNITVHSSADSTGTNDLLRGTNLMDEEIVHFVLTLYPNFKGNIGRNLVTGYINGCKNFQFEYTTGTVWGTEGDLIIGAEKSDVSLYFIRTYQSVLSDANVQANYINSLSTITAREDMANLLKSVMDANGTNISYESVKNSNQNFFVLEMLNGATVPSRANGWTKDTNIAARSNLEMHYGNNPSWDWKIYNVETMGQGTTSMGYYRWNLRWRIDKSTGKKVNASYLSARTERAGSYSYTWEDPVSVGSINFDGNGTHPALKRMTAKINFASSMQSHKIGATRAFDELHSLVSFGSSVGLPNEAQAYAEDEGLPAPTVAVYEYPAYGFQKSGNDYVFIGLFTIGPDKGDKPTFGYNINDDIADELITIEGTDHSRKMVMFNAPWNNDVRYLASNECINIVKGTNDYDNGWEVANCHDLSTDEASDEAAIQTILEAEFKPAYDLAFNNSTLILGIPLGTYGATAAATIEYINSNIPTFQSTLDEEHRMTYANYQFWIEGDYKLYYYDIVSNSYVAGVNLVTDLGTPEGSTVAEQNEWFRAQRRARFKASAENYWDIDDTLFQMAFLVIIGAMDNFGKNSYPYKMKTLAHGGRWKWRQDDLDSIGGIGNAGADNMPTWMEFPDSNNGSVYFGGSTSVFWNLIYECYYDDYTSTVTSATKPGFLSMGKATISAMAQLGGGSNILSGAMNFIQQRFWDNAQDYFPQSAYNADAAYKYEAAWLANDNGQAEPLTQSLGNHFSAEQYWFRTRLIYMMSLFKVGPFGTYSDSNLGQIVFRPQSLQSLTVTPAYNLYPAFASGQGMVSTARTWAGEEHTFNGPFGVDGQTTHYINAADLLSSLGDLKDLQLGAQYVNTLGITGKKLIDFKIGEPNIYYTQEEIENAVEGDDAYGKTTDDIKVAASVSTNVPGLTFTDTNCLEVIDARNAESITGSIDLSNCRRLREAYFDGTSLTQIRFANGQPLEKLSFPDSIQSISMRNMKFLTDENVSMPDDLSNITLYQVENCGFDAYNYLGQMYNSEGSNLRFISIMFTDIRDADYSELKVYAGIAQGLDSEGNPAIYGGVSSDGSPLPTSNPNVDGVIRLTTPYYEQDFIDSGVTDIQDYGLSGLKIGTVPALTALRIIFDPTNTYIAFADQDVANIAITNWGDGDGLTKPMAAAVTTVGSHFRNNTSITEFTEFKYFTGLTNIFQAFYGDTALTKVTLPPGLVLGTSAQSWGQVFQNCSSLQEIDFSDCVRSSSASATLLAWFVSCSALTTVRFNSLGSALNFVCNSTQNINQNQIFGASNRTHYVYINGELLEDLVLPDSVTGLRHCSFYRYTCIKTVTFSSTLASIGGYAFNGCSLIEQDITLPNSCTSVGTYAFGSMTKMAGKSISMPNVTSVGDQVCYNTLIKDLYMPKASITTGTWQAAGNGEGTITVKTVTRASSNPVLNFKEIVVLDDISTTSTSGYMIVLPAASDTYGKNKVVRIGGDVSSPIALIKGTGTNTRLDLKFFELMGKATGSADFYDTVALSTGGCTVHLGYDAYTNEELPCTPANVRASSSYVTKIYVGTGESAAGDQAILDMYLADSAWAAYSSKLDLWYNYDGDYKESPFDND